MILGLFVGVLALAQGGGVAVRSQIEIPPGEYAPLYPADPAQPRVSVSAFRLDAHPVTKGEYLAFVLANPKWQRGAVAALFADEAYLQRWATPIRPDGRLAQPVTEVSWFAARAYCEAQGQRLPTEDEWEYVARASESVRDASDDPKTLARILAWYGEPTPVDVADVGAGSPNVYEVHDMHGLVWEWVEDFNNTLFGTDGREGGDEEVLRFCGSGALSATDVRDYASFMRTAFRSSLDARSTTMNLGFRCASDEGAP